MAALFLAVLLATVATDWFNGPDQSAPAYLTGLLGATATALFATVGSDQKKRQHEATQVIGATADRAEAKADVLTDLAREEHPNHTELSHPPLDDKGGEAS